MKIRKFKNTDAKEVCEIIERCDKKIASKDYSKKVIDLWISKLNPNYIIKKSRGRICFVAILEKKVVGYISFDNNEIKKLHVNPNYHNLGIGKKLIGAVENYAHKNKIKKIIVKSSIYAEKFYEKCSFRKIKVIFDGTKNVKFKLILMEKEL